MVDFPTSFKNKKHSPFNYDNAKHLSIFDLYKKRIV